MIILTEKNLHKAASYSKRTKLYAYKAITNDGHGPYYQAPQGKPYVVGGTYSQRRCNRNPKEECGVGLHLATKKWIAGNISNYFDDKWMALVSFTSADIACIPMDYKVSRGRCWYAKGSSIGKFRVTKFKIEKKMKLPRQCQR